MSFFFLLLYRRMIAVDSPFPYVKCSKKQSLKQHFFINFFAKMGWKIMNFHRGGGRRGGEKHLFSHLLSPPFFADGISSSSSSSSSSSRLSTKVVSPLSDNGQRRKKEEGEKGIICGDLVGGEIMGGGGGLPADTSFSPAKTGGFANFLEISFVFFKYCSTYCRILNRGRRRPARIIPPLKSIVFHSFSPLKKEEEGGQ